MLNTYRNKAFMKGVSDGRKWAWHKRMFQVTNFPDYYKPPFFFKKWYGLGFDKGAELEID